MSYWKADLGNIIIASGGSSSTSTPSGALDDALSVAIYAPATLTTACKVQGTPDGTTWNDVLSGGTTVLVTSAQVVELSGGLPYVQLRMTDVASTEATTRSFSVIKVFVVS